VALHWIESPDGATLLGFHVHGEDKLIFRHSFSPAPKYDQSKVDGEGSEADE